MIDQSLLETLQSMQTQYCWSVGAGIISDFECSIWERAKWQDKGRLVINAHGESFNEAIANALKKLSEREAFLREVIQKYYEVALAKVGY